MADSWSDPTDPADARQILYAELRPDIGGLAQIVTWVSVTLLAVGYLLGGVSAGYWLVRRRTGGDVRAHGSGATGATNAGRILGRQGFVITLVLDAAKGALVALAARMLGLSVAWSFAAAVAVVAGHVWPAQLGFRGGRGVAPLLGAWIVLAPLALVPTALTALGALAITRRFVWSGLCGLLLLPLGTYWATGDVAATTLSALALVIVLLRHKNHWRAPARMASVERKKTT